MAPLSTPVGSGPPPAPSDAIMASELNAMRDAFERMQAASFSPLPAEPTFEAWLLRQYSLSVADVVRVCNAHLMPTNLRTVRNLRALSDITLDKATVLGDSGTRVLRLVESGVGLPWGMQAIGSGGSAWYYINFDKHAIVPPASSGAAATPVILDFVPDTIDVTTLEGVARAAGYVFPTYDQPPSVSTVPSHDFANTARELVGLQIAGVEITIHPILTGRGVTGLTLGGATVTDPVVECLPRGTFQVEIAWLPYEQTTPTCNAVLRFRPFTRDVTSPTRIMYAFSAPGYGDTWPAGNPCLSPARFSMSTGSGYFPYPGSAATLSSGPAVYVSYFGGTPTPDGSAGVTGETAGTIMDAPFRISARLVTLSELRDYADLNSPTNQQSGGGCGGAYGARPQHLFAGGGSKSGVDSL